MSLLIVKPCIPVKDDWFQVDLLAGQSVAYNLIDSYDEMGRLEVWFYQSTEKQTLSVSGWAASSAYGVPLMEYDSNRLVLSYNDVDVSFNQTASFLVNSTSACTRDDVMSGLYNRVYAQESGRPVYVNFLNKTGGQNATIFVKVSYSTWVGGRQDLPLPICAPESDQVCGI